MRVNYAIVFVSDMDRSIAFYRDALGLTLRFESPYWTEFETEGATLALHAAESADGERFDSEHPTAGHCRPGFSVPDLRGFHDRMLERGVRCLREPSDVAGSLVAQYADPDGLSISVGEYAPPSSETHHS
jgi:lactoylglutathione lyase